MATYPPSAEGVVLVDFDGTIVPWGHLASPPAPLPGVAEAIGLLRRTGHTIGIFTSRLSRTWHEAEGRDPEAGIAEQIGIVEDALSEHGIHFDFITAEKVPAVLYLDDKAMRVNAARPLLDAVVEFITFGDEAI